MDSFVERYIATIERLESENAKLREAVDYMYQYAKTCGVDADDLRTLGVEVDDD